MPFASVRTVFLLLALLTSSCGLQPPKQPTVSTTWMTMGTIASLTLPAAETEQLDQSSERVKRIFEDIEQRFSIYRADSFLSRLREKAGREGVPLDAESAALIREALRYADMTGGAFDPTVGPLLTLWGFDGPQPETTPDRLVLDATLDIVGWQKVVWLNDGEPETASVSLARPGMRLDLGGIAKGYALDLAFNALTEAGLTDFMIDLGGELRCQGTPGPGQAAWRIGVRHPFKSDAVIGTLPLTDGLAVATSGHYERFRVIDNRYFAHIIDPRTGLPASEMAGVTILSRAAIDADALSTALFVMGMEEGAEWLREHPSRKALLVPNRQPLEIHMTPKMAKHFEPLPEYAGTVRLIEK